MCAATIYMYICITVSIPERFYGINMYIYISMYNRIGVKKKKSNEYKNDRKLNDRASDTIGGSSVFITLTV